MIVHYKTGKVNKKAAKPVTDFNVENCGSIFLFRPMTERARNLVRDICEDQPEVLTFGGAMVVEAGYAWDMGFRLNSEGYNLE